jgi:hypothetical protein
MVFSHLLLVGFPSRVGLEAEEGPSAARVAKTLIVDLSSGSLGRCSPT